MPLPPPTSAAVSPQTNLMNERKEDRRIDDRKKIETWQKSMGIPNSFHFSIVNTSDRFRVFRGYPREEPQNTRNTRKKQIPYDGWENRWRSTRNAIPVCRCVFQEN
jgi:hypothetical protein